MKYFINFSGGFDSTYYLWRFLKENPKERILVHHCLLFEARRAVEKSAVDNILRYFRTHGMNNFEYVETQFSRMGIKGTIYDIEPLYFLAGLLIRTRNSIKTVFIPICREELDGTFKIHLLSGKPWGEYKDARGRFYKSMLYCKTAAERELEFKTPYYELTKRQMIKEMPPELVRMVWYCRRPRNGKPCRVCFNCRRVQKALK